MASSAQRTGTARVEHVVHEHDALTVNVPGDVGGVDLGRDVRGEVVAVEADVQASERDLHPLDLLDGSGQMARQDVAAGDDAHDGEVLDALVTLDDLVRDARERALDGGLVHDDRPGFGGSHRSPSFALTVKTMPDRSARHGHPREGIICFLAGVSHALKGLGQCSTGQMKGC